MESGARILMLLVLLTMVIKMAAELNVTRFELSCQSSFRFCQPSQCKPMPKSQGLLSKTASIGMGYDIKTDRGEGLFRDQLRNRVFDFTYCDPNSTSAPPVSVPVLLPCEAHYDSFDPPIINWNRDVRMFSTSQQFVRARSAKLGLTRSFKGIEGKFGFSRADAVQSLSKGQNYYAVNDRRVLYGIVSISDWRCYPFTPSFKAHVRSLHPTNPRHSSYVRFIAKYGHAVTTQVHFGGRTVSKASLDKCEAYDAKDSSVSVQESAYETLAKGLQVDLGGLANKTSKKQEQAVVDIQTGVHLGGDSSLADDDDTFFQYVKTVRSQQAAISVSDDNSLTPLYELLGGNINLFVNETYDAAYWEQVQQTLKIAFELDLQNSSDTVDGSSVVCSTPTPPQKHNERLYYLFFLLVFIPTAIILFYAAKRKCDC